MKSGKILRASNCFNYSATFKTKYFRNSARVTKKLVSDRQNFDKQNINKEVDSQGVTSTEKQDKGPKQDTQSANFYCYRTRAKRKPKKFQIEKCN